MNLNDENFLMRLILLLLSYLFSFSIYSFEVDKLDIENHPQSSFPQITLKVGEKRVAYYGMDSSRESELSFEKESTQLEGEIPLSGYIFAKEFVESFRLSNLVSNKKNKNEFIKVFSEQNPGKMVEFLLAVGEKKRVAKDETELGIVLRLLKEKKSDEDPGEVAVFSTGYIELKSPKNNNERYFIKISDVKKENLALNSDKTKINLLKSITVYSFQNVLSGLNFGEIEKGSEEEQLFNRLENLNLSLCNLNCTLSNAVDLSSLALKVGKVVSFEVVGNSKIENMDDFNKYVLAQQWCLLTNFSKGCRSAEFEKDLQMLGGNQVIKSLINKHGSVDRLCTFFQK